MIPVHIFRGFLVFASILLLAQPTIHAGDTPVDMKGWEAGSEYNKSYNAAELDKFRATVVEILEVTPMEGMSPASAITVKESDEDDPILVHLCPVWFADKEQLGLSKGDRIKLRGVWAEIDGKDVFMASKIKKGDFYVFKVRLTIDGTPFWTMSEEQLAKEKQQEED
jgi:hypothetical protein